MASPTLVVMAAGIGKRYGGLKQLDPVGPYGEILLDYSIYDALRSGFQKILFVINQGIEADFRLRINSTFGSLCDTAYIFQDISNIPPGNVVPPERKKPWGTAHAVLSCKENVRGSFGVINADDFYGRSSFRLLHDNLKIETQEFSDLYQFCLVGYRLDNTLSEHGHVARGVCRINQDGYLDEVIERTHIERVGNNIVYKENDGNWIKIESNSIVSMNMWGFTDQIFSELESSFERFFLQDINRLSDAEFFLPDVVNQLLEEKKVKVKVLQSSDRWFGVTYPSDKVTVQQAIQKLIDKGIYPEKLWGHHDPG